MHKLVTRSIIILLLVILNISCDQVSKAYVRSNFEYNEQLHVIENHVILTKVENRGAFLSLGSDFPPILKNIMFLIMPCVLMIYLLVIVFIKANLEKMVLIGYCFIIGGGIGNIYDRLLYGSVTDFMHIGFGALRTGIFNMADVSVMVGVGILVLFYSFSKKPVKEQL